MGAKLSQEQMSYIRFLPEDVTPALYLLESKLHEQHDVDVATSRQISET